LNFPKMLYQGEAKYTDSAQIRDDLMNRSIKTVIVANEIEEKSYREQKFVDLVDLLKPKTLKLPEKQNGSNNAS